MSLHDGYAALERRDFDRAESLFNSIESQNGVGARRGLARVFVARGQLERARHIIELNMQNAEGTDVAIYGDVLGKQGNREAAQKFLQRYVENDRNAYVMAVLGEQQIRQGEWDIGTSLIADSINLDESGEAMTHITQVVSDLSIAASNGRLPTRLAERFVSNLLESIDRHHLRSPFESAKSAISRGETWTSQNPAEAQSSPPRTIAGGTHRNQPQISRQAPPVPTRPPLSKPIGFGGNSRGKIPPLIAVMRKDRELNEQMQDAVVNPGLPDWPSFLNGLDPIPVMKPSLLDYSIEDIKRASATLTEGVIANEIMIERAVESMRSVANEHSTLQIRYRPESLSRLELMVWDGLFDRLPPVPDVYRQNASTEADEKLLALAGFLGNVIAKFYGGSWRFEQSLASSSVHTEGQVSYPFRYATQWLNAQNKDDVNWYRILDAPRSATQREVVYQLDVLDLTHGLAEEALTAKLAMLWLDYLGRSKTGSREAAESVQILQDVPQAITFAISDKFTPDQQLGVSRGIHGLDIVAYSRVTGEFLLLRSIKHMERLLDLIVPVFQPASAKSVVNLFDKLHCPNLDVSLGPIEQTPNGHRMLAISSEQNWALTYQPTVAGFWRIETIEG